MWGGKTQLQMERELLEAVERARARYEGLDQEHSRMVNEIQDGGLVGSDGTLALAQSKEKHRAVQSAVEEYRKALKRFHRLVVDRKLPEE